MTKPANVNNKTVNVTSNVTSTTPVFSEEAEKGISKKKYNENGNK